MQLTKETLLKACPVSAKVADTVVKNFNLFAPKYNINTPKRIAAFIAQCAHESAQFTQVREYASGAAYEGRKDLGNTQKGDGVRFKGRGYIQLTGRNNYRQMSIELFGNADLLNNPELLATPVYAMQSAMIFWKWRDLNRYADIQYFETITRRINGGLNGFRDRIKYYNILCKEFGLYQYSYEKRDIIKPTV